MLKRNVTLERFIERIEKEEMSVICFGVAKMAKEALDIKEIRERTLYFIDNNKEKQGKEFLYKSIRYPIKTPEELQKEDRIKIVLLITSSYYMQIEEQLKQVEVLHNMEYYVFPLIRLNFKDEEDFFQKRILEECLKEYRSILGIKDVSDEDASKKIEEKRNYIEGVGSDNRPFVLPRIMIMPTTRCNMRCRDCSSLLPYFKKPQDLDMEKIKQDINVFLRGIDECIRITVGGEPFLYPHLKELLEFLLAQQKLLGILLITNSTIQPKQEVVELLKNDRIFVQISDYGHLEKMSRTISLFEKNKVHFEVLTEQIWVDMGNVDFRNRSEDQMKYTYLNCDQGKVVKAIHNGRFHTCGRSARMFALGVYESEHDYIDLLETDTPNLIQEKIKVIYNSHYADACNYCDCGALPTKEIPAGIQIDDVFQKSNYTIVNREEYEKFKLKAELKE